MWDEIKREGKHIAAPPGFDKYIDFEGGALCVRQFTNQWVPGLLQTPDYARAVLELSESAGGVEERLAARIERQGIFDREPPARMVAVLDEAVLRRPLGGAKVIREQLEWLVHLSATRRHISVCVLPFTAMTAGADDGSFTILTLPSGLDIGYHEGPEISQVIEEPAVVAEYSVRWDLVMSEAMSRSESHKFILRAAEDYT
ncbi:DUF5753 domain-containing protein [Actinomadura harenae]|uniref:XRE family transcriptional regulator n=1 Tax=Actinomadura harenae TaxID=2483351 RepID=A0A3M2M0Z6_9ACTN|nr:DUF5753 domain-containing protein [Actinomadura harenae]RMI42563.1 XRE family transcriptional regulator [Actinomadura harenae]